jgi:tetratricopeptide (TPR) repeat protein
VKYSLASRFIFNLRATVPAVAFCLLLVPVGYPQQGASEWEQAQAALKRGAYAEAEASFRKFLASSPAVAEGHVNLGLSLHLQNKHLDAIPAFRHALQLQPRLSHAYLFLGIDLFSLNNTRDALVELRNYTNAKPKDPQGHYYTGLAHAARGATDEAVRAFEKAAELAPANVDILYHLAQAYITCANSIAQRASEHDPKLALLRDWERKHAGMDQLVHQSPGTQNDKAVLATLQPRLGRIPIDVEAEQRAAAAYAYLYLQTTQRFVELDPNSFRVHQLLAAYYDKIGDTEKAIAELERIVAKNVKVRGVHFALGSIYKDRQQSDLALHHLRQELQVSAPEPETRVQVAQVLLNLQRNTEALRELEVAKQHVAETSGNYWRTLGKVYTALERHADAVASFEKAVELGPSDRTLLYQLGQAYRRNGNFELARKLLAASNEAAKAQLERERARTEKVIEDRARQNRPNP